jgi:exopolysaccharide biosynthesis predicted pyruvyltransferase EpsI
VNGFELRESLDNSIDQVLDPLMEGVSEVALLDFPPHSNVGDSAIWLGERAWIMSKKIVIRYVSDNRGDVPYASGALRRCLPTGSTILLQGGGSINDIWPGHQTRRERILAELPDYRVIQLPQSMHFDSSVALEKAGRAFRGHPDFHLLVRDQNSYEMATESMGLSARLCPDMAFKLRIERPAAPEKVCAYSGEEGPRERELRVGYGQPRHRSPGLDQEASFPTITR